MKRFWSDELQDEISRLTGLCVEQRDRIARLEQHNAESSAAFHRISTYLGNQELCGPHDDVYDALADLVVKTFKALRADVSRLKGVAKQLHRTTGLKLSSAVYGDCLNLSDLAKACGNPQTEPGVDATGQALIDYSANHLRKNQEASAAKHRAMDKAERRVEVLTDILETIWKWSPKSLFGKLANIEERERDPKIAKVVDDFIQREACGMREEIAGVCISDGVNSTIVDLSSDHT